uniref:Acid phosphatase n=1 Tax=Salix viminalis TaxID=40686 RepID=A0A6N2K8T9_SALVM
MASFPSPAGVTRSIQLVSRHGIEGGCPAIPAVLGLFKYLVRNGFKVFLITGRDQETLGQATTDNLRNQGFIGYERLIFKIQRQRASAYKSEIRRRVEKEGYRIWERRDSGAICKESAREKSF